MAIPRYHEQGNSKAVIAYLDENNSSVFPGESFSGNALIEGYPGMYTMVHFPVYYYRNEDLGNNRYKLYVSDIKVNDYYKEERECLIGAFEAYINPNADNTLCSWPNRLSSGGESLLIFYDAARRNSSNWGLIDYRAHKTIANMFCVMYNNTDIDTLNTEIPCSHSTKRFDVGLTGSTMSLGNKDGRVEVSDDPGYYSTSFLGLEDCCGSKWELVQGINIVPDRQWVVYDGGLSVDKTAEELIAEGFTNVRTIGTAVNDTNTTITKIKHGEYADIMPLAGRRYDYQEFYYKGEYRSTTGHRIIFRSGSEASNKTNGVFTANCFYTGSDTRGPAVGTRLGFYGPIEVVTPEEWLKLSPQFGDNSGSGGIN